MDAALQLAALRLASERVQWARNEVRSCCENGRLKPSTSAIAKGGGDKPVTIMGHVESDGLRSGNVWKTGDGRMTSARAMRAVECDAKGESEKIETSTLQLKSAANFVSQCCCSSCALCAGNEKVAI